MEQTARRKVDGLTVRVYNTGSVIARGPDVSAMKSHDVKVVLDVPVFLIKHPKHGYILFDTGMHPDTAKLTEKQMRRAKWLLQPVAFKPGQDLISQLTSDGVASGSIKWVVLSHLHFDHAGFIDRFENATVVADKREWSAVKSKRMLNEDTQGLDPDAIESKVRLQLIDFTPTVPFGAFDHGLDLFNDGSIYLVDLAGHTAGSLGLWANLDDGPILLAGDASWVLDNHQDLALPSERAMEEPPQYQRHLHAMRAMQEAVPRLVIFPGHDLAPLRLQQRRDVFDVPLK